MESVLLPNMITGKNSLFIDLDYIYFIGSNSKEKVTNFSILSIEMLEQIFKLQAAETNPAKKESR